MSLIFSALSEIDKQAQDGQAEYAGMGAASAPGIGRRGILGSVLVLLLIVVLCLAAYHFYRSDDAEQSQTQVVAASAVPARAMPAEQSPATARATESGTGSRPAAPAEVQQALPSTPVATAEVAQDPPYAPVSERKTAASGTSGGMTVRIVGGDTGIEPVAKDAPAAALVADSGASEPVASPQPPSQTVKEPPAQAHTVADTAPVASQAGPGQAGDSRPMASPEQQAPAPRAAQDDAPMIGSNNFIKVGKQPEAVPDKAVPRWVQRFREAMAQGDHSGAKSALGKLESALSPESLTLLRMQAWYAVDSGDDGAARAVYSRLLQRLPDDINAGVNVALIDWRAGRRQQALQRINTMHTQHPDSDLIKRNWQVMHQQRR